MEQQAPQQPSQELIIDEQIKYHISNTTRWAKFLSIVGFVVTGIIVLMAFSLGTIMTTAFSGMMRNNPGMMQNNLSAIGGGSFITVFYLLLAVLYFIPCLYLYRFARRTRLSLENTNQENLLAGMEQLSRFFKFVGILTLIYVVIIALIMVAVIIGGMVGGAMT